MRAVSFHQHTSRLLICALSTAAILLVGVSELSAAPLKKIKLTRRVEQLLLRPDGAMYKGKPLVCLARSQDATPKPGYVTKSKQGRQLVLIARTKRNATAYEDLVAQCRAVVTPGPGPTLPPPGATPPPTGECSVPAGFAAIRSEADFRGINQPAGNYVLCNDIELTSEMTPLMPTDSFRGVLEGNNKALRGLQINAPASVSVGLFRMLQGGTVRNLRIIAPQIRGKGAVGTVAGISAGRIENVLVEGGHVLSEKRGAGALVGIQFLGSTVGSQASALVTAEAENSAALVGIGAP